MVGVDEVGRGCLAGPLLVVAARAQDKIPLQLKDSKLLSRMQREKILPQLLLYCQFGEGWVSPAEIDSLGLAQALKTGTEKALTQLSAAEDEEIIMDGKVNYLPKKFKNTQILIRADSLIPVVSAAGIYAKVKRDEFMRKLALQYPEYAFERHVGYGTKLHLAALEKLGAISGIHRASFKPVSLLRV